MDRLMTIGELSKVCSADVFKRHRLRLEERVERESKLLDHVERLITDDNGHEMTGLPSERYISGPTVETDPSKYQTEVVWPLKEG